MVGVGKGSFNFNKYQLGFAWIPSNNIKLSRVNAVVGGKDVVAGSAQVCLRSQLACCANATARELRLLLGQPRFFL